MKSNELPAPLPRTGNPAGIGGTVYSHTVRRLVDRFTYPAERPSITLTIYYAGVLVVGILVVRYIPGAADMISGKRLAELGQAKVLTDPASTPWFVWNISISMSLSMVGAFFLMLPTSWVYMATRQKKGFDQQVVQTFIVLAVAVAGVIMIARNSVALAFSLAGVVGAVRFRNTLPETRDSLYIFLAIGVGLAAGVDALTAAFVLSALFNFIMLAMERMNYGSCALGSNPRALLVGTAPAEKKAKDFNAVLLVRTADAAKARAPVEAVLGAQVRRFQLAEIEASSKGRGVLKYLIRVGKRLEPEMLEDALILRCAPNVLGARIH